jgi:hypothetical protein
MKNLISILFCLFVYNSFSQGFDWQYNPRLPQEQTKVFIGGTLEYGLDYHQGDFDMREIGITCCRFSDGTGANIAVGAALEFWMDNGFSAIGSLKYNLINAEFTTLETLPTVYGEFQREFIYSTEISYLSLGVQGRYKFIKSGLSLGFGFDLNTLLSSNNEYRDRKISPPEHPYQGATYSNRQINDLNNINIFPKLSVAYDISLRKGFYSSIYAETSTAVFNMINSDNWRLFRFSAGIRVLTAID